MISKKTALVMTALLLGGCLSGNGESLDASSETSRPRQSRDGDKDNVKPRQVCESTSIGGEAKSFCY